MREAVKFLDSSLEITTSSCREENASSQLLALTTVKESKSVKLVRV